jgi:ATP-binding cassette subfamily B multidrug efflux pump
VTAKAAAAQPHAPGAAALAGDAPAGRFFLPELAGVTNRALLRWMFTFVRPVRTPAVVSCALLALGVASEIWGVARVSGLTVERIQHLHMEGAAAAEGFWGWMRSTDPQAVELRRAVVMLLGVTLFWLVIRYARAVADTRLSMTMVFHIREAVYDKLQRVGFGFHDAVTSGQLINRALSDLQNVRAFLQTAILLTLEIVLVVLGYIALIATRSPLVAALSLIPLPVWTLYVLRFSRRVQPAAKAVMEAEDKNVSIITENIAGVHVVKAFATEDQEVAKYNRNADDYYARVRRRIRMFADFQPVMRLIGMTSHLSLFLAVGVLMIKGRMNAGDFLILGTAMNGILSRLQQVSTINEQYQNAIVSARRLYEVLMAPATIPERAGAPPLPKGGPGRVAFEHVSFGYAPGKPVLHDVSFDVPGGSIVAIVGPTGAGKTTLVNLIARFYEPQQGRVVIDGFDVRDASLESLRTDVAFVFQETYLFSDTVAGNIAYGRPHIDAGQIEAAARLAQAHEFIEHLPLGYETMLGERGSSLSGGQRQRLAIARAILTNPRVLILDDATASVDPETEDLIRRGMTFVMKGRTTFVIAHRVSTVKQADLVLVMEHGRITQRGTHAQLMREAGHYREIAAVQLYGDDIARDGDGELPSHMDRARDQQKVTAEKETAV